MFSVTYTVEDKKDQMASSSKVMLARKKCTHCLSGFVVLSGSEGASFCSSDCRSMRAIMEQDCSSPDDSDDDDKNADFVMIDQTQYGMRQYRRKHRGMSSPMTIPQPNFRYVDESRVFIQ
ncbi:hypothetical protein LEN26_009687 [Aphanomyces euteiches]|uniref:Uncharacterized protein n=1 Tax=Aphanomyces euteiches TaxID=100861 RepID=A0A6G0XYB2_9STRA|nr:hypothetical protein Ae201684_000479 [Aphanomyces euteiches]KAH9091681.1 hypothetical protein Ae201684P_011225 [Aphanomyces euteiches]KAH9106217.1 hypothetical protein AeMF1_018133 [Aphanomyces euteiches]KAH9124576.1 hypothetical protein LEN26_009687 [Aphanomyces euteiches]KAH9134043.1 hypothetical protein AeRB84_020095 [Aphanomyces euteiches]